ncbi:MAG TPA: enoyl-CoA hydratase/isomerase family protein [Casimicrobiaceae bacterium]|nr:enoyl-CoA hydratase/isomerase family protein [Casimicrobiaceae bacterium]
MTSNDLIVAQVGDVCSVTIHRPEKMNPLSRSLLRTLRSAFEAIAADPKAKCVILRGAGERYFAAGGDLHDLDNVRSDADTIAMAIECRGALDTVRNCPLPVVAAINGDAIGGGAELALACDMRVMAEHANIGYVHGRLAITAAWGGGTDLIDLVGASRALRMMASAETIDAFTALEWGLADVVVPSADLDRRVNEFVEPIRRQSQYVLRAMKAQVMASRNGATRDERRALELKHIMETWTHADHWRAVERVFGARDDAK